MENIKELFWPGSHQMSIQANSPALEEFQSGYQFILDQHLFALLRWEIPSNTATARTSQGMWTFKPANSRTIVIKHEEDQAQQEDARLLTSFLGHKGSIELSANPYVNWFKKGNQLSWVLANDAAMPLFKFKPQVKAGKVLTQVEVETAGSILPDFTQSLIIIASCFLLGQH